MPERLPHEEAHAQYGAEYLIPDGMMASEETELVTPLEVSFSAEEPNEPEVYLDSPKEKEVSEQQQTRAVRFIQAKQLVGFYPQEKEELVQVTALSSHVYDVGGAAKLLAEVQRFRIKHTPEDAQDDEAKNTDESPVLFELFPEIQAEADKDTKEKKPYDPAAALRAIVRTWEGYVKNSRGELTALLLLKEQLRGDDIEPLTAMVNVSGVKEWKYQDITQRAIGAITREFETQQFAEHLGPEYTGTQYVTNNREVLARESAAVSNLRVREARQVIDGLIISHQKRMEYWKKRIEEAARNRASQDVARTALEGLSR